jgi:hypothetical protein
VMICGKLHPYLKRGRIATKVRSHDWYSGPTDSCRRTLSTYPAN